MLGFFSSPRIGLEITARSVKAAALTRNSDPSRTPAARTVPVPAGMVGDAFASPNIRDTAGFAALLRELLREFAPLKTRRIGLSLPDTVFRVQNLEFDELPSKTADRDRLVRWRVEKGAAFDAANTVFRYQALPRQGKGFSVLACMAKQDVLGQYEEMIASLGYDAWTVGPASFHALNFHYPALRERGAGVFAFAWITDSSYAVLVSDRGAPRFYRCKEIRQGTLDAKERVLRELEDSLHFYAHLDRDQLSDIGRVFLGGDASLIAPLAEDMKKALTLEVEVLATPSELRISGETLNSFSSVFGAGGAA